MDEWKAAIASERTIWDITLDVEVGLGCSSDGRLDFKRVTSVKVSYLQLRAYCEVYAMQS